MSKEYPFIAPGLIPQFNQWVKLRDEETRTKTLNSMIGLLKNRHTRLLKQKKFIQAEELIQIIELLEVS